MKIFQSSSSETQLSDFKSTLNCLPGVVRRLPCFHGHATHQRIKEPAEVCCATARASPGVVAKLMGLDSIPQRISPAHPQEDQRNLITRSPPISQTPMVLELENGKFFVLGFEAGGKGKEDSKSNSKRKLLEDDESKKKKLVTETSNGVLKEGADDFELEFLDQLVLELVYIF